MCSKNHNVIIEYFNKCILFIGNCSERIISLWSLKDNRFFESSISIINSCYFSKFFNIFLYFLNVAFKYSIFNFSLTNHFFRLIKRKLKTKKKRERKRKKITISYKIRNKSISSKMFIVSNFSSTVNPFSMIMERWTSSFELTRNNYEIIRGYHGVNEFITRNHGVLCDLCRIRFTKLLEKEEREGRKRKRETPWAFGWSFVRDPCNFLPVVPLTSGCWKSIGHFQEKNLTPYLSTHHWLNFLFYLLILLSLQ